MSKKKENELRKAALEGDIPALTALIASGTNLEGGSPKDGQTALSTFADVGNREPPHTSLIPDHKSSRPTFRSLSLS